MIRWLCKAVASTGCRRHSTADLSLWAASTATVQQSIASSVIFAFGEDEKVIETANQANAGEVLTAAVSDGIPLTLSEAAPYTATYKWFINYGTASSKVVSTSQTCKITAEVIEAANNGKGLVVIAEGTGNYIGTSNATGLETVLAAEINTGIPLLKVAITNAEDAAIGVTLNTKVVPAQHANYAEYQWYKDGNPIAKADGGMDPTFTPAAKGDYYVQITSSDPAKAGIAGSGESVIVLVGTAVTANMFTIENSTAKADGRTTNRVGDSIVVTAKDGNKTMNYGTDFDVDWYIDSVSAANLQYSNDSYNIASADMGHTIIAVARGYGDYSAKVQLPTTFSNIYAGAMPSVTTAGL